MFYVLTKSFKSLLIFQFLDLLPKSFFTEQKFHLPYLFSLTNFLIAKMAATFHVLAILLVNLIAFMIALITGPFATCLPVWNLAAWQPWLLLCSGIILGATFGTYCSGHVISGLIAIGPIVGSIYTILTIDEPCRNEMNFASYVYLVYTFTISFFNTLGSLHYSYAKRKVSENAYMPI
jgi:hypothetical protein